MRAIFSLSLSLDVKVFERKFKNPCGYDTDTTSERR